MLRAGLRSREPSPIGELDRKACESLPARAMPAAVRRLRHSQAEAPGRSWCGARRFHPAGDFPPEAARPDRSDPRACPGIGRPDRSWPPMAASSGIGPPGSPRPRRRVPRPIGTTAGPADAASRDRPSRRTRSAGTPSRRRMRNAPPASDPDRRSWAECGKFARSWRARGTLGDSGASNYGSRYSRMRTGRVERSTVARISTSSPVASARPRLEIVNTSPVTST